MPRNRSGGLAALSSSVRRTPSRPYPVRSSSPLKRRLVAGILALVSLVLITGYFRESDGGPFHEVQSVAATAMHPFEVGAERLARPFRDAYGWLSDLFNAREENQQLKEQIQRLRNQAIQNSTAASEVRRLQALLDYRRSDTFPTDYDAIGATVLADFAVSSQPGTALLSVATVNADGDNRADLVVGSGAGQSSAVRVYLGTNLSGTAEPTSTTFDPFGAVTINGVFVG